MSANTKVAPIATSTTSPTSNTQGKIVPVDVLHLDDIPKAMDKMGWKTSAAMMRRWFANSPAFAIRPELRTGKESPDPRTLPPNKIDDQIIKMKWLLSFDRVIETFEDLCQNWNSERGINQLHEQLNIAGWSSGKTISLGKNINLAKDLEKTCQVNVRQFGSITDTIDDLFGAIYNANLKLAVVGKTSRSWLLKKDIFEIEKLGIYVRDTYDFNAGWREDTTTGLGIWSKDRCLSKAEAAIYMASPPSVNAVSFPGFVPVKNTDFRRWQAAHNTGGDFYVYSDVMWIPPNVEYIKL